MGAINVNDRRKGGHFFQDIFSAFENDADFLLFGQESHTLKGVHAMGLIRDYRKMPILYSAADLFVGTSLEEAFGQTFCEAAACEVAVAGFNIGGIPEAARHDYNARLADDVTASALINEIRYLLDNSEIRSAFAKKRTPIC